MLQIRYVLIIGLEPKTYSGRAMFDVVGVIGRQFQEIQSRAAKGNSTIGITIAVRHKNWRVVVVVLRRRISDQVPSNSQIA